MILLEIINNFNKMFPNFIYQLQFENFLNNPEDESKKLIKYCGLPWDKKCLEFYKRKDLISKTTSNIQIRKAINKNSIKKYLPYKQFLSKFGDKYNWFLMQSFKKHFKFGSRSVTTLLKMKLFGMFRHVMPS